MQSPTMTYLTDIYFGCGIVSVVPDLLAKYSVIRPLVITDPGVIRAGLLQKFTVTPAAVVFDRVQTNPTESSATQAADLYRSEKCDGIIALGGGAAIDLAKIAALLIHHPPPLQQYAITRGGIPRIIANLPPLIAIPTTAGSGSEVGRAALLTLSAGEKLGFLSPHLLPKAAVCDPELTLTLPPLLTAATGMDAISHCVEAFCSPRFNPVADSVALDALRRGVSHIEAAVRDGSNLAARTEMTCCSLEAGLAFQKGLGAVHSLSHPLGALAGKHLHHGTLNAIFLPHVLRFNAAAAASKLAAIANVLQVAPENLAATFAALCERLGLPPNLAAMGVSATDLEPLAEHALHDHCSATNPRPLTLEDCRALYAAAHHA